MKKKSIKGKMPSPPPAPPGVYYMKEADFKDIPTKGITRVSKEKLKSIKGKKSIYFKARIECPHCRAGIWIEAEGDWDDLSMEAIY